MSLRSGPRQPGSHAGVRSAREGHAEPHVESVPQHPHCGWPSHLESTTRPVQLSGWQPGKRVRLMDPLVWAHLQHPAGASSPGADRASPVSGISGLGARQSALGATRHRHPFLTWHGGCNEKSFEILFGAFWWTQNRMSSRCWLALCPWLAAPAHAVPTGRHRPGDDHEDLSHHPVAR